jgi:predicted RNase H-like HicB family nuclease
LGSIAKIQFFAILIFLHWPWPKTILAVRKGKIIMREAVVYPGEDGYWVAECPSLPGCISQGKTREKAIANIKEAIEGFVLTLKEDGIAIPEERFETLVVAV